MRGRKPEPTHLKELAGRPVMNKREPRPRGNLKTAPAWFTDSQRAIWDEAIADAPLGMLKRLDRAPLVTFCIACDLHRQASEKVAAEGMIVASPVKGDPMQSPYLPIVNKQAQIMLKSAAELGFTPVSRSRVSVTDDDEGETENPLGKYGLQ